jgi:hypothetical protein
MVLLMGFLRGVWDGLRHGRDAALADGSRRVRRYKPQETPPPREATMLRAERPPSLYEGCRVHGKRYPGCPLDRIERGRF